MPATPSTASRAHRRMPAVALAVAVLLSGCSGGSSSSPASSSAVGAGASSGFHGAALPAGIAAPGFTLTDQHGRPISLARYRGQVTVLAFLYSTCGAACILVAQQIRGALDQLSHPVPVLVVSADPAADTPANVARFLKRVSLGGRLEYLTGAPAQLQRLWRSYRITPPSAGRGAFARAASVLLIDRDGRERVLFGIEQLTPESLAHDIGKLDGEPAHP